MTFVVAAVAAGVATLPAVAATLRGTPIARLVALQVVSSDIALLFAILAGASRASFDLDLALATGLLSFVGALALVRFVGRWT